MLLRKQSQQLLHHKFLIHPIAVAPSVLYHNFTFSVLACTMLL